MREDLAGIDAFLKILKLNAVSQVRALCALGTGELTQGELGSFASLSSKKTLKSAQATLARDALEERGYCESFHPAGDRRTVMTRITPVGLALLRAGLAAAKQAADAAKEEEVSA